jgi:hypothetical protein
MPLSRTFVAIAALLLGAVRALAAPLANGTDLNGTDLNGVELNGASLGGSRLENVHLEGSTLVGVRPDGTVLSGADLVGAILVGRTEGGAPVQVRIDGYAESGDVSRYEASFNSATSGVPGAGGSWEPVCASGPAAALSGVWNADGSRTADAGRVTFACPGGALAKCVDLGYAPWRGLESHHQACTRAIRADYCGSGSSYTQNGRPIDMWDRVGVQADTEAWTPEAEWGEGGAVCMTGEATRATVPVACEAQLLLDSGCGKPNRSAPGGLLVTELP